MTKPKRKQSKLPKFKTEAQERKFWLTHDSADYVSWHDAEPVIFPRLKPSTTTISLRLPNSMLAQIKVLANQRDVPYQSLLKVFLSDRLKAELKRAS